MSFFGSGPGQHYPGASQPTTNLDRTKSYQDDSSANPFIGRQQITSISQFLAQQETQTIPMTFSGPWPAARNPTVNVLARRSKDMVNLTIPPIGPIDTTGGAAATIRTVLVNGISPLNQYFDCAVDGGFSGIGVAVGSLIINSAGVSTPGFMYIRTTGASTNHSTLEYTLNAAAFSTFPVGGDVGVGGATITYAAAPLNLPQGVRI